MEDYRTIAERDLEDYKIIANAAGEWAGLETAEARERIRQRHEYEYFK